MLDRRRRQEREDRPENHPSQSMKWEEGKGREEEK